MTLHSPHESLGAYAPGVLGARPVDTAARAYVTDVGLRVVHEMAGEKSTDTMFGPFAQIANFALASRQLRIEVMHLPPLRTPEGGGPGRPLGDPERAYVTRVLTRVADAMGTATTTAGLPLPLAKIANFILVSRAIRVQVTENPELPGDEDEGGGPDGLGLPWDHRTEDPA